MKLSYCLASSLLVLVSSVVVAEEATVSATAKSSVDSIEEIPVKLDENLLKRVKALANQGLFVETFEESETFDGSRWFKSSHEKYASQDVSLDQYTVRSGHLTADKGLVLDKPAKHYALAVKLDSPLQIDGSDGKKELVVQYEVKLQKGLTCGGAYVKLLRNTASNDFAAFSDSTPFVIMFGPDKCGSSDKVHFIFQHKKSVTGQYEEKHLDSPPQTKSDRLTHLYTLVVRDDNTYELLIDQKSVSSGSLLENFSPSVIPEKEIDDPTDEKPADWVEEAHIPDPSATKPEDWNEDEPARIPDPTAVKPSDWLDDEPALIDDPSVVKPEDWDDEDDGEWVAPQISNPKCESVSGCGEWERPTQANPAFKGKWKAPIIPNPAYKGEWAARKIANPEYFEDAHPARMDPISALAVEVWTMSEGITFDNFWLGNDFKKAEEFASLTFAPKQKLELQEEEKQREKDKNEMEARRAKESSIYYQVRNLATGFVEFTKLNPVVGVGMTLIVTILTFLAAFYMCCAKSEEITDENIEDEDKSVDEKNKGKESITEDEVDESKKQLRQRKKAPVVN